MGLPFGTSSSSSNGTQSAGSEGDMELQARMDLRRKRRIDLERKRRIGSNCRRLRKQQHLDDLISQVNLLKMENQRLITEMNITAQSNAAGEAQNSVLRTQMKELEEQACALHDLLHECKPVR